MKEKAAYLRGLIEGLGIDETTKEGKVIKAMSELLGELAEAVDGIDEDVTRAYDQINDLSEELEDLEADLYEDDEDDEEPEEEEEDTEEDDNDDDIASEPFYEVACPNCGETVYVSEDDLDAGEANCAHCGVTFEVALEDDDEEQGSESFPKFASKVLGCFHVSILSSQKSVSFTGVKYTSLLHFCKHFLRIFLNIYTFWSQFRSTLHKRQRWALWGLDKRGIFFIQVFLPTTSLSLSRHLP